MMLTRCPTCSTAFRVTPEQLKARAGKVRCGHCKAVFNALESLQDTPPAAGAAQAPPKSAPPIPPGISSPEPAAEDSLPAPSASEPQDDPIESESVDILLEAAPADSRRHGFAWAAAGLLALGLLIVQAAYVFRAELAVSEPGLRPLLEDMCGLLDCDIALPRKANFVGIEASDLYPDPQRKNLLVLVATLKNRAPFAQDYPHLELTLTDTRDQPIVRKVFAPAEYLAQGADVRAGFAANGDLAVNLGLDATDLGASGYRLYLFYP